MTEIGFRYILLLILVLFVGHRGYYSRKYGRPHSDVLRSRGASPTQTVAGLLSVAALLSTAAYVFFPGSVQWASLELPDWLRALGIVAAVLGFALLQWAHLALGRNWSDTPRLLNDQRLVTEGPYRWVRHPMYTAFLIIFLAPLLLSANWLVGVLWLSATALDLASRVRFEEALLAEQFGETYAELMSTTGRILPRRIGRH